ncbi:MAG TPA: hypothetical protein VKR58_13430, partial [Aquella sp.]|nr:hypothetical protein [Aquella sp.]
LSKLYFLSIFLVLLTHMSTASAELPVEARSCVFRGSPLEDDTVFSWKYYKGHKGDFADTSLGLIDLSENPKRNKFENNRINVMHGMKSIKSKNNLYYDAYWQLIRLKDENLYTIEYGTTESYDKGKPYIATKPEKFVVFELICRPDKPDTEPAVCLPIVKPKGTAPKSPKRSPEKTPTTEMPTHKPFENNVNPETAANNVDPEQVMSENTVEGCVLGSSYDPEINGEPYYDDTCTEKVSVNIPKLKPVCKTGKK